MDYVDFIIQVDGEVGGRYTVKVSGVLAGESGAEPLTLPTSAVELGSLNAAFARTRDLRRVEADRQTLDSLSDLGGRLFSALLPGNARNRYARSVGAIDHAPEQGLRLRIQMDLNNLELAPLHAVPWEYLYDPDAASFLATNRRISIVRHLQLSVPGDRPLAPQPLSVLLVASDDPALDLDRERTAIEAAWSGHGSARVKLLSHPTLEELREELLGNAHQVVHFMGHGGFDPQAGEGSLAFSDGAGNRNWVSSAELAEQLADRTAIRLVVLNACWTARAGAVAPYAGVATSLLRAGVPSVLAMQFPISDLAAFAFSRMFYRRLSRGDSIDAAVTEGRMAIRRQERSSIEWGTPVLFERMASGRLVEPAATAADSPTSIWLRRPAVLVAFSIAVVVASFWLAYIKTAPRNTGGGEPPSTASRPAEPSPSFAPTLVPLTGRTTTSPSGTAPAPAAAGSPSSANRKMRDPGPAPRSEAAGPVNAGQEPASKAETEAPAASIISPAATRAESGTGRATRPVQTGDSAATGQASAQPFWQWLGQAVGLTSTSSERGSDHIDSGDVWLQSIEGGALHRLTFEGGYTSPVFAPDDQSVLVLREGQLWRIPTRGGKPMQLDQAPAGVESLLGSSADGVVVLTADQIGTYSLKTRAFSPFQPVNRAEREAIAMMHSSGRAYGRGRPTLFERNGVVVVINAGHSREIAAGDSDGIGSWSQPSASHDFLWIVMVGTATTASP